MSAARVVVLFALCLQVAAGLADLQGTSSKNQHQHALVLEEVESPSIVSPRWFKPARNDSSSSVLQRIFGSKGQELNEEGVKANLSDGVRLLDAIWADDQQEAKEKSDTAISESQLASSAGQIKEQDEKGDTTMTESHHAAGEAQNKEESGADEKETFEVRFSITQKGLKAADITTEQMDKIQAALKEAVEKLCGDEADKVKGAKYKLKFVDFRAGSGIVGGQLLIDFKDKKPDKLKEYPGEDITSAVHKVLPDSIVGPELADGTHTAEGHKLGSGAVGLRAAASSSVVVLWAGLALLVQLGLDVA